MQAELPARVSRMRRVDKPLNPYIVLAVGPDGCALYGTLPMCALAWAHGRCSLSIQSTCEQSSNSLSHQCTSAYSSHGPECRLAGIIF